MMQLAIRLAVRCLFRTRVSGQAHIPPTGGAVLVPNEITFLDGLLLAALLDRPVRFVVDAASAASPLVTWLMRRLRVISLPMSGDEAALRAALQAAGSALDHGELLCLFTDYYPDAPVSLRTFRQRLSSVVESRTIPLIPLYLDRIWGTYFRVTEGRLRLHRPERIPTPIAVSIGSPLPANTPAHHLRRLVCELGETAWRARRPHQQPIHRPLIATWRRHPFTFVMADAARPHITGLKALIGTISLARAMAPHWSGQQHVGLLLPPSVPGALLNIAAALAGKTSVNLNYTVGRTGLESAIRQARLTTVVTSRLFVEKAKLDLPDCATMLFLEDLAKTISGGSRLIALALGLLAPINALERACGRTRSVTMTDLATIIFSSGSTGDPKGVMLSHAAIAANVEGAAQIFHLAASDRALGVLPFFHSFGYLLLWFYTRHQAGIVFHPSPLDAAAIGDLCGTYRVSLLVVTPTFLQLYLRRCTREQFRHLRVVITGAEKLPLRLADAFRDSFGTEPVEGYGVTECSPVVAVNCPDAGASGFSHARSRRSTVGQPLPGVLVRIVDPDTWAELPPGHPGMLLVKGPNVMDGYLGREDLTAQAMQDRWYITGDIAALDEDGFLTITDRLSRFSKIGGEMVPHGQVEEALHQAAGLETQAFAVTGLPDEKKGERLAVLHTLEEDQIPAILAKVSSSGLPNLFIPSRNQFVKVDALPLLGTGKLDLRGVKRMALERLGGDTPS